MSRRQSIREELRRRGVVKSIQTLLRFASDRLHEMEVTEVASSMALATLLAVVPVLALSLALFAAFPGFAEARQALENFILESFLPTQYTQVLMGYLQEFAKHAAGLTTFGIAGLVVTSLLLIDKLFVTVNRIFKVKFLRPWSQRALIYWALLSIGPIAVMFSLTLTGRAAAMALEGVDAGISAWLLAFGLVLLQGGGYTLIYKFVPSCRVQFAHALAGGMLTAGAGWVVRQVFEYYVMAGSLTTIYGAFVALPVLILWIYVAWLLFFIGAAITATIPMLTAGRFLDYYRVGDDFLTGVLMLQHLTRMRLNGQAPLMSLEDLCDAADTHPEAANKILTTLTFAGYLAEVTDHDEGQAWVLVADTQTVTLAKAFEAFAVDARNSLVRLRPKNAKPGSACGQLHDWWVLMRSAEGLTTPLAQLFAEADFSPDAIQCAPTSVQGNHQ